MNQTHILDLNLLVHKCQLLFFSLVEVLQKALVYDLLLLLTQFHILLQLLQLYILLMIISILLDYIYKFYKNLKYIYNRFLLERYLYKIKYRKQRIIKEPKKMYKNITHIIKIGEKYQKEEVFLNNMFDLNKKI